MRLPRSLSVNGATAVTLLAVAIGLSAAQAVPSRWATDQITIDGALLEWPVLTILGDGISVAAANDNEHTYLAVATSDRQRRRQLSMTGLTIWLDRTGGRRETYGIVIPGTGFERPDGRFGAPSDSPDGPPERPLTYVELLGPGKDDRRRIELSFPSGIAVASGINDGTQLYELRIPLATASSEQPFGLGATPNRPLGLGLVTPKPDVPQGRPSGAGPGGGPGGGGGRGGGRGGGGGAFGGGFGGGGFGGGRGGDGRGRGPQAMTQLKLWTTVTLAPQPR